MLDHRRRGASSSGRQLLDPVLASIGAMDPWKNRHALHTGGEQGEDALPYCAI
jgi:hypothetical protein